MAVCLFKQTPTFSAAEGNKLNAFMGGIWRPEQLLLDIWGAFEDGVESAKHLVRSYHVYSVSYIQHKLA